MAVALSTLVEEADRYLAARKLPITAPTACRSKAGRK
jgi:hypothetical protein